MTKLEEEAAAFKKRARPTERKRRQRSGGYVLSVEVHLPSLARMLFADLKEGELEDATAISAATAAHLRNHQRVGRVLPDQTPRLENKWQEMESWVHDQEFDREEYDAEQRKLAKRLDEQGPGPEYYEGPHVPVECQGDRRGQSGRNPAGERVQFLRDLNIEKRGDKIGRARIGTDLPGRKAKKIKPPAAKRIDAAGKKIEKKRGPLVPADTSVHTIAAGDVERKLNRMAWDELGYAKRKAPPVTDSDKDDPGNWS